MNTPELPDEDDEDDDEAWDDVFDPYARNIEGRAYLELARIRDTIEIETAKRLLAYLKGHPFRQIEESTYFEIHDEVACEFTPHDIDEVAFLLGLPRPDSRQDFEEADLAFYEEVSSAHCQVDARFGGVQRVVVSVHPQRGMALHSLEKLDVCD